MQRLRSFLTFALFPCSCWQDLPQAVLIQVVTSFSTPHEAAVCRRVCSAWALAIGAGLKHIAINQRDLPKLQRLRNLTGVCIEGGGVPPLEQCGAVNAELDQAQQQPVVTPPCTHPQDGQAGGSSAGPQQSGPSFQLGHSDSLSSPSVGDLSASTLPSLRRLVLEACPETVWRLQSSAELPTQVTSLAVLFVNLTALPSWILSLTGLSSLQLEWNHPQFPLQLTALTNLSHLHLATKTPRGCYTPSTHPCGNPPPASWNNPRFAWDGSSSDESGFSGDDSDDVLESIVGELVCGCSTIPESLSCLTQLTRLDLGPRELDSYTGVTRIKVEACRRIVGVQGHSFQTLPDTVGRLTNLRVSALAGRRGAEWWFQGR